MLKWITKNRWYIAIGFCLLLFAVGGIQSVCVNKAKTIRLQTKYDTYRAIARANNEIRNAERKTLLKDNEALQKETEAKARVIADQKKEIYIIYTDLKKAEKIVPVTENEKMLSAQLEKCVSGFSLSLKTIEKLEENTFSLLKQYDNQVKITDSYIAELSDEKENHQMAQQLVKRLNRELKIARTYNKIYKGIVIGGIAFVIYSVVTK